MENLVLFIGNDHGLIQKELARWRSTFANKYGSENIERLQIETLGELINNAQQTSLFSEKRLVIVYDLLGQANDLKAAITNLKSIPTSTIILFVESNQLDRRKKTTKDLLKILTVKQFALPDSKNLNEWIQNHAQNHGKTLSYQLVNFLRDQFQDHPELLHSELEKLYTYSGDFKQISYEDGLKVISPPGSGNVFALTDSLTKTQTERINTLHKIYHQGEDLTRLLYLLTNQIRNLQLAQQCQGHFDQITGLKLHPFVQKKLRNAYKLFHPDVLNKLIDQSLAIDSKLKNGEVRYSKTQTSGLLHELEKLLLSY